MTTLEEWNEHAREDVSTEELDKLVDAFLEHRSVVDEIAAQKKEAQEKLDKIEHDLLGLLDKAKKVKYHVSGLGTVELRTRYSVKTPKDNEAKRALFDYIKQKHGPDALMGLVSINSNTLNSFNNQELESDPALGKLPGLESPVARTSLAFRKEKK